MRRRSAAVGTSSYCRSLIPDHHATHDGDTNSHEHIYWDQASVLMQIKVLDPKSLPVRGAEGARSDVVGAEEVRTN